MTQRIVNELRVWRDFWLRPLCALGRHRDKRIRPGVYECQRAYCLRVRKVRAEMDGAVEARCAQAVATLAALTAMRVEDPEKWLR